MSRRRAWRRLKAGFIFCIGASSIVYLLMASNIHIDTQIPVYHLVRPRVVSDVPAEPECCRQDAVETVNVRVQLDVENAYNVTTRPGGERADDDVARQASVWTDNITETQLKLMARVHDVCNTIPARKYVLWKHTPTFYIDRRLGVSYCLLANEIDDYFAGVFDVLKDETGTIESFIDTILTKAMRNEIRERITYFNRLRKSSKTILFASNPYERLLTGYIDEVYLSANDCENMTFQAFLDHVISGVKLRLNYGVNLFPPIIPGCRVCGLAVLTVIRRQTLVDDLQFTFNQLPLLPEKVRAILDYSQRPELYILPMVETKLRLRKLDKCRPAPDIGTKLWRSFQVMGILPASSEMPPEFLEFDHSVHVRRLAKVMVRGILEKRQTTEAANTQRRRYLADEYSGIKDETIDYIKEIYKYDFELFGYDDQLPIP